MRPRLATVCAALVALLATVPAMAAAAPHPQLRPVEGKEPFRGACGIAAEGDRVFVSSYYERRIVVLEFDPSSQKYKELAPIPTGEPSFPSVGPCDLALDSAGNLYVNNWHHNVVRYVPAGPETYARDAVLDSNDSTGIAIDPATDNLFVDNRTYVAAYEPSGAPVLDGGEPLRIGDGSLGDGYGVAVSGFGGAPGFPATSGRVYVADAAANTVKAYDPAADPSTPVQIIDGGGTPRLGFTRLVDADLAVDHVDGHVYVTDNLEPFFEEPEAVVHEFSSLGHYRGPVPPGVANGRDSELVHGEPTAVAVVDRDVYVTTGNYFDDGDDLKHLNSKALVFGPAEDVETDILTVAKTGAGAGTVFSSSPAGLGCGTACEGEFTHQSTVVLNAVPALHSRFVAWTGCQPLSGQPPQCSLPMTEDRAVSAEFEPVPQQALTVAKSGSGAGTVSSEPAGIDCGSVCAGGFDEDSEVTLTATAAAQSRFAGWTGCDSEPQPGRCLVAMGAPRSVEAAFEAVPNPPPPPNPSPPQRILAVSATGVGAATGTVTSEPAGIDCGGSCANLYTQGTTVTLVAHPASTASFLGWGGCDSADGNRCTVTLGGDRQVVAAFGAGFPGPLRIRGLDVRGGTAVLRVSVPAPGLLVATGPKLLPASALPVAAGRVGLRLRLSAAGRRALARAKRDRLGVRVTLVFSPLDGGTPVRTQRVVTFGSVPRGARPPRLVGADQTPRTDPAPRAYSGVSSWSAGAKSSRSASALPVKETTPGFS